MCMEHAASAGAAQGDEEFVDRLVETLNRGTLCLMISIGHRAGLFDTMAGLPPSTSREIARAAGLEERYVREWLAAMTTGRIVEYDADRRTYRLPPQRADFLTRDGGGDNLAVFAQYVSVLGRVEDDVLDCFEEGGGVPYSRFDRFHDVMAEDSGQTVLPALIEEILPLAPGLTQRLERGIRALDVGCGRGKALHRMASEYPSSEFVGLDLSEEAVAFARDEARRQGLDNAVFEVRDVTDFDETAEPEAYDLVTTFDAIHDQARPLRVLKGIRRTLKADGVYLMQDIHASSELENNLDHPLATTLYTVSTMHCMTVSLAQGGEGLGTMWGREKALELLEKAGFESIDVHRLEHDIQNDYYVVRKGLREGG